MKKLSLLLLICFPIFATGKEIGVDEYLQILINSDAEIERVIQQKAQTRFNKDLRLPTRSWVLSLSNSYGIPTIGDGRTSELQASLTKNFRETGTTLSLRYNQNDLADRNEQVQSIQLEQSLIQNSFGLQTRLLEESIDADNKLTNLRLIEGYEDYVADKMTAYLDFIVASENLITAQNILKDFKSIFDEVRKRKSRSIALDADLYRAEAELLQYERAVLEAKATLSSVKRELFLTVSKQGVTIEDLKPQKKIPYLDDLDSSSNLSLDFLKGSRTGQIIETSAEAVGSNKKALKRQMLPELNLILALNEDESNRFATTVNRQEFVYGFNLTYELDNSLAKARFREAQNSFNLNQVENKSRLTALQAEARDLNSQIDLQKQRLKLSERQADVSKKLIAEEKKRFGRGLLSLRDFIIVQTSFTQSQYTLIEEKVNLARLIVRWKQMTDSLIVKI